MHPRNNATPCEAKRVRETAQRTTARQGARSLVSVLLPRRPAVAGDGCPDQDFSEYRHTQPYGPGPGPAVFGAQPMVVGQPPQPEHMKPIPIQCRCGLCQTNVNALGELEMCSPNGEV